MKHRSIRQTAACLPLALLLLSALAMPGQGDDWFGEPIVTEVDNNFGFTLEVGDLDRDGHDDFVAHAAGVVVFLSDSTGHFAAADTIPHQGGSGAYVLLDEDHDGLLDLVVVCCNHFTLQLWRNDGAGHFSYTGKSFPWSGSPAAGDADGDGFADLLVAYGFGVMIYYGSAEGLGYQNQYLEFIFDLWPPEDVSVSCIQVADLDGDSINDVIISGISGENDPPRSSPPVSQADAATIRWRLGLGNREFAPVRAHMLEGGMVPKYEWFDSGDLDNDGDLDVVAGYWGYEYNTQVLIYEQIYDKLVIIDSSLPFGIPHLARLDDDDPMDLYLSYVWEEQSYRTKVYRGLGGADFENVQDLIGARGAHLGVVVSQSYPDMISIGREAPDLPIALWPNQIHDPNAVDEPEALLEEPRAFWIWPQVATSEVWIHWTPARLGSVRLQVVDVQGRIVRELEANGIPYRWDLRDGHDVSVGSGIYWLRLTIPGYETRAARIVILR